MAAISAVTSGTLQNQTFQGTLKRLLRIRNVSLALLFLHASKISAFTTRLQPSPPPQRQNPRYRLLRAEHLNSPATPSTSSLNGDSLSKELYEVDVLYGRRKSLHYDASLDRFLETPHAEDRYALIPLIQVAFVPSGVTPNYFRFMQWRIAQRFVNANLHVFGTQSLLLGLGLKSAGRGLGLSAALNWVLKDALGKIIRMIWASRMGRRFDSDAKRWRFRSALVFAVGNGFEILTYVVPHLFLLLATLANCCKQVSMLTSSSTRTAIYNSFRDGTRENIGDITAKGEAQIAVVDLLGIATGVTLSKTIGTSIRSIAAVYFGLQALEIFCMYQQLRSVQYKVLNFERMIQVVSAFCDCSERASVNVTVTSSFEHPNVVVTGATPTMPTPQKIASKERLFLPPHNLARRENSFGSLGRAKLSPSEFDQLVKVFAKERFVLVVGENLKHPAFGHRAHCPSQRREENCHIILHEEASNIDIVKSTLALTLLRRKLAAAAHLCPETMRSSECLGLIESAYLEADSLFSRFLRQLTKEGWESPARAMFGRVHMRAFWPLLISKPKPKPP